MNPADPPHPIDGADLHHRYVGAVRLINGGKRVGEVAYLHVSLLAEQMSAVRDLVFEACKLGGPAAARFNVVRIALRRPEVALLDYPAFFEVPFPALLTSWLVDLETGRVAVTDFSARDNPPILHRKELLLAESHPNRGAFERLTTALEDYGVFDQPAHLIGHRAYWASALDSLGLRLDGHEVKQSGGQLNRTTANHPARIVVERHRTAIARSRLSTPMQALARWGFFDEMSTVLDYGCGRGDDIRALAAAGVSASGWDPHFAPDIPLEEADIVSLGFVLNVIEDPTERVDALRRAYGLTRRLLVIAVMLTGQGSGAGHSDGVLTSRGTFQRYFSQAELREYVADVLGREPVTVGPGIVFVFRADENEQEFLARRQHSTALPVDRFEVSMLPRAPFARPSAYELHQDLLDAFWGTTLELGRLPEPAEFGQAGELLSAVGSMRKAFAALPFNEKRAELMRAAARRMEDLLVYLALNVFERRSSFQSMPIALQRDIKSFFGSHKVALERARTTLFEAGNRERSTAAMGGAAARGLGVLDSGDGDYTFHAALLDQQPASIRIILGCAERLEPLPLDIDLVKVHGSGDRVSYLRFDGFSQRALPILAKRTVIDLRRQRVAEVSVGTLDGRRVLLGRASFLPPGTSGRERQVQFDDNLRQRGVLEQEGLGPGLRAFARQLVGAGVKLAGDRAIPKTPNATSSIETLHD